MSTRSKSLFNKKVRCVHCSKFYKKKTERGKSKYICSSYDNKGECIRIPIEEDYLVGLIEKRLNIKVDRQVVEEYVEMIHIEDAHLFEIFIKNQESIFFSRNGIRY